MDIRKLQRAIVDGLEDVKAQAIAVYNTEALSPLFERVIIATGSSNRQTKALAASVRDKVRERGLPVMRTEGQENGEWIIVDCGAAVVHIMQPEIRDYYHLEEIWGGKPVKMKLAGKAGQGLVKASEPMQQEPARKTPPRPTSAHASSRTSAKTPVKTPPKTRAETPAKTPTKTPAKKQATARRQPAKGGARTVVVAAPARKKAGARAGSAAAGTRRRA